MRKRELLRLLKDDTGLVALLWVMGFAGFLAFFAIVMESGLILAEKRNLQNSADAAALAGAQALVLSEADAINDAVTWAGKNTSDLVDNNATVFNDGVYITATVSRNAQGVFNDWLSFGRPLVTATATARLASPRLPGPGVFC
ncbi:MAG: pilus assembly protein TadG-related protein, partial [Dehalococcoidia bacterium]